MGGGLLPPLAVLAVAVALWRRLWAVCVVAPVRLAVLAAWLLAGRLVHLVLGVGQVAAELLDLRRSLNVRGGRTLL